MYPILSGTSFFYLNKYLEIQMGTCTCVQEPKTKFVFTKKAREASQEAQLTPDAKGSKKSIDSERITRTSIGQSNLQSDALVPP